MAFFTLFRAGGQNVNKIEGKVEIIFNIFNSKALNPYQKGILLKQLENKLNPRRKEENISEIEKESRKRFSNSPNY